MLIISISLKSLPAGTQRWNNVDSTLIQHQDVESTLNWLLRQKAITMPMRKSLNKQYRDTCICQWKLHSYLYLSKKKYIGNIVCLSNNINR